MKYSRKSYRKKSTYRRKRSTKSYRKKTFRAKRAGGKQITSFQNVEKVVVKQVYGITQRNANGSTAVSFVMNLLNPNNNLPNGIEGYSPSSVQADLQTQYNELYEERTIDGVAIKLVFPA